MDFRTSIGQETFGVRASALIVKDGQICMIQVGDVYYTIGGAIEVGELTQEAVKREVKEELGIDIAVKQLAFVVENQFQQGERLFHNIEFHYLVAPLEAVPVFANENGELRSCVWLDIDKLVNYDIRPEFLKESLSGWTGELVHIEN